jgi:hypothetical protein
MKKEKMNRNNFTKYIVCAILIVSAFGIKAQNEDRHDIEKPNFKSHLFYGGGFGLQVGSVTLIELSPMIGYKVTPKFGVGVSPSYKYYRYQDYYNPNAHLQSNVFGGSVFARYIIFQNVFAHAEYESLFYNTKITGSLPEKTQYNSVLIGGGYQQNIGGNAGMYILVLWNLNDTPDSPYTNPVIRVGFNVGF